MATKRKSNPIGLAEPSDDWQTRNDLETLIRAEEIKRDPKRHAKAKALAKHQLTSVAGVVAAADKDDC